MTWDKAVPGIFIGPHFASHPSDDERAFEWLTDLRKRKVGWKAARQQLEDYMRAQGWQEHHIQIQLQKAESMMKSWLTD